MNYDDYINYDNIMNKEQILESDISGYLLINDKIDHKDLSMLRDYKNINLNLNLNDLKELLEYQLNYNGLVLKMVFNFKTIWQFMGELKKILMIKHILLSGKQELY